MVCRATGMERSVLNLELRRLTYSGSGVARCEYLQRSHHLPASKEMSMSTSRPTKRRCLARSARASQACEACAVSKVKCDDSTVCRRCCRKNIECVRSYLGRLGPQSRSEPRMTLDRPYARSLGPAQASIASLGQISVDTKERDAEASASEASWWEEIAYFSAASEASTDELLSQLFDLPQQGSSNTAAGDKIDSYHHTPWDCVKAAVDITNIGEPTPHISAEARHLASYRESTEFARNAASDVKKTYKELFRLSPPEADQVLDSDESQLFLLSEEELFSNETIAIEDGTTLMPLLEDHTRDRILLSIHLSPACISPRLDRQMSLPSLGIMRKLLHTFFNQEKRHIVPFIHVPTFEPSTCDVQLLLACIATGGAPSTHLQLRSFSHMLMELGCRQTGPVGGWTSAAYRKLTTLQALQLQVEVGLWSADSRCRDASTLRASSIVSILKQVVRCRGAAYRKVDYPLLEDKPHVLETKWRRWIEVESFKRLEYRVFMHCAQESVLLGTCSAYSFTDVSTPIPSHKELWYAPSAIDWRAAYLRRSTPLAALDESPIDLHSILRDSAIFTRFPRVQDSELAYEAVLHCSMTMISEYEKRCATLEDPPLELASSRGYPNAKPLDRHINRLLDETRATWETGVITPSSTAAMLLEFNTMMCSAPLDAMGMLFWAEDPTAWTSALDILRLWRGSRAARKAVWHAGQIMRSLRSFDELHSMDFIVVVVWRAALCLWTYRSLSVGTALRALDPCALDAPDPIAQGDMKLDTSIGSVQVDGCVTLKAQEWIAYGGATPVITIDADESPVSSRTQLAPLCASPAVAEFLNRELIGLITTKFSTRDSCVSVSMAICQLLHSLGELK